MDKKSGVLIICKNTARVLLLLENPLREYGSVWSLVAGSVEDGEEGIEAAEREVGEELGVDLPDIDYYFVDREEDENEGKVFNFFVGVVDEEFNPDLSSEHVNFGWFERRDLPEDLYPGLEKKIMEL